MAPPLATPTGSGNSAPTLNPPIPAVPGEEIITSAVTSTMAPAPLAPPIVAPPKAVAAVKVETEVVVQAIENCGPYIGHYRLNLVAGKKYKVPGWVAEDLIRGKMATKTV